MLSEALTFDMPSTWMMRPKEKYNILMPSCCSPIQPCFYFYRKNDSRWESQTISWRWWFYRVLLLCSASAPSFQLTALLLLNKQLGRTCVDIQRTCNRFWLCVARRGTCTNRQTLRTLANLSSCDRVLVPWLIYVVSKFQRWTVYHTWMYHRVHPQFRI